MLIPGKLASRSSVSSEPATPPRRALAPVEDRIAASGAAALRSLAPGSVFSAAPAAEDLLASSAPLSLLAASETAPTADAGLCKVIMREGVINSLPAKKSMPVTSAAILAINHFLLVCNAL